MKKEKLFAFWKYSEFPYLLGGEIDNTKQMKSDGRVYVPSYQNWFLPEKILPLEAGRKLNNKLKELGKERNKKIKELKKEYNEKLKLFGI